MNKELIIEYAKIKTPEELLEFMSNFINYGYLSKDGRVYYPSDEDFDSAWYDNYILENKSDILTTGVGNCWDQTEFERSWFKENNYEVKTIYEMVLVDYKNNWFFVK